MALGNILDRCNADDLSGVLYQRVKVTWGVDGVANDTNASTPLPVTVASTTSITPGTAAANLGKAEDAASADGDVGVGAIAIRKASPANTSSTDGDYEFLQMSAGRLWTSATIDTALPAGSATIGNVNQAGTWNITNISGTVSLPTGAATAAKQPALGTAGAASADVITIQGVASMTKLLVTPDSVALPANQSVNVSQINGVTPLMGNGVTGTGSQRVTIASDNTAFSVNAVQSGTWNVGTVTTVTSLTQMNGAAIAMNTGTRAAGVQRVTICTDDVVPASQSGTWTVQPGNTANTTAWLVQDVAGTTGGMSFNGFVGAASNNKTQIKGSAGTLYLISVQNLASTPVYLKVFNNTSAGVTAGTTACDFQFMIPGNTAGAGVVLDSTKGIAMGTGITIMLTAAIGTTDNTSVSANQQVVLIGYK